MHKKSCFILNFGPHYRFPIYKRIVEEFDAEFYLGDREANSLKGFDYNELPGYRKTLKRYCLPGGVYWLGGSVNLVFKNYEKYILTGEPLCLSNWVILIFAWILGKKTISWTHGWYGREHGLKKWIKKFYFHLHTKCMCYNEYGSKLLVEQGIKSEKVCVVYNSLDSFRQRKIRERLEPTDIYSSHFGNSNPVLIYCGRIQRSKKLDLLLKAVAKLKVEGFDVSAVLVGKEIENVGLHALAEQLEVSDRVWFYGPCYDEEKLAELFYNATVCVSPGNVGLTAIHSLTYGCPVITHDNLSDQMPEFEAVRPCLTGDFFKEDSVESLTNVIKQWIGLSIKERQKIRMEAYKEIDEKWNVENQISVLTRIL